MARTPLAAARDQFAGVAIGSRIYAFGGNRLPDGQNLKSLEICDTATGAWSAGPDNEHASGLGVEELTGAAIDGRFYVCGALVPTATDPIMIKFFEEYDPVARTWTTKTPMPTMRTGATAVAHGGKLYLFGGSFYNGGAGGSRTQTAVVEAFDPASNSWQFETQMPKALASPAIAVVAGKAYLFGGGDLSIPDFVPEISIYDFATRTWAAGGTMPRPRVFSYAGAMPVVGSRVFMIGGFQGPVASPACSAQVDAYDTAAGTWETLTPLPVGVSANLCVAIGGQLYSIGGNTKTDGSDGITSAVWSLAVA